MNQNMYHTPDLAAAKEGELVSRLVSEVGVRALIGKTTRVSSARRRSFDRPLTCALDGTGSSVRFTGCSDKDSILIYISKKLYLHVTTTTMQEDVVDAHLGQLAL
jgi:hypothetical protein